jgi:alkanesulfonate monooxygenase SsuD/methylene tetrahydromethanopterin reductase-like flavin-dependent oxidoreductase (luciferase family)
VALGWHSLPFESLLSLTRSAEHLGYASVFVDGDVSMLERPVEVLDGLTVTTELLARTDRIEVTSIRLVHYWNAARLAQTYATLARLHPGRVSLFASIGGHRVDRRFGLPYPPASDRVHWLDEMLEAVRALWQGGAVTRQGRFVQLDAAVVRPRPAETIPIRVAAGGSRALLEVVARHADAWDVNLPPMPKPVADAAAHVERMARALGRDPGRLERSMWLFTRPGRDPQDPALTAEFRRFNPWFRRVPDSQLDGMILSGPPGTITDRIAEITRTLDLDLPVLDLSGLGPDAAGAALEALAPGKTFVDSNS